MYPCEEITERMQLTLKLLLSVFLLPSFLLAHEGHQAFYKLFVENGVLTLKAKLEIPDVKSALKKTKICPEGQDLNFCAGNWLIDHVAIAIDGRAHSLMLESSATDNGHLLLTYSLGQLPDDFREIDVKNTAFTSAFHHYENIFEIELHNQKKGYKLTETRTSITHQPKSNR